MAISKSKAAIRRFCYYFQAWKEYFITKIGIASDETLPGTEGHDCDFISGRYNFAGKSTRIGYASAIINQHDAAFIVKTRERPSWSRPASAGIDLFAYRIIIIIAHYALVSHLIIEIHQRSARSDARKCKAIDE